MERGDGDEGGVKPETGWVGRRMVGGSFRLVGVIDKTLLFSLLW